MLSQTLVRYFSKQIGKVTFQPKSRWKKLIELFSPEKCYDAPEPKTQDKDLCAVDSSWSQPRVIIIGAGMAGLSAAQLLLQCGIHNFLILEATDRPGGRIHSRWMGDCMTELGAMWIEGASVANLIFLLAAQEGLLIPPLQRIKTAENTSFFTTKGRPIEQPIAETALQTFQELIETRAVVKDLVKNSNSLGEFVQHQLSKELSNLPQQLKKDITNVIGCLYNELQSRIGQDPCYVHPLAMAEKENLPGGRVRIPLGFGSVLAPLLRTLPPCSIVYCKPVHFIQWDAGNKSKRATVVCSDKEEHIADYVIITVPLGVLKNNVNNMFSPTLPKNKIKAIEKLGFGEAERVFIQYDQPFWVGDGGLGLGWKLNKLQDISHDWRHGLGRLTGVPGSHATLQGVVGGEAAIALCETPQERLITEAGELLRQFTGDMTLPDPKDVQCSHWTHDPFFNGAYTYLGLNSEPLHIQALAEPVPNPNKMKGEVSPPVLFFAGEATSPLNYSTVHGARESGIREAQNIIRLTHKYHGPPVKRLPCPPCP